jgi:hypothetical protein
LPFSVRKLWLRFRFEFERFVIEVVDGLTVTLNNLARVGVCRCNTENVVFGIKQDVEVWKNVLGVNQLHQLFACSFR